MFVYAACHKENQFFSEPFKESGRVPPHRPLVAQPPARPQIPSRPSNKDLPNPDANSGGVPVIPR